MASTALYPFDVKAVPFDIREKKWVEVTTSNPCYDLVIGHIATQKEFSAQSFRVGNPTGGSGEEEDDDDEDGSTESDVSTDSENTHEVPSMTSRIGYGFFEFQDYNGEPISALHQKTGDPVGTNCGPVVYENLILFTSSSEKQILTFLRKLLDKSETNKIGKYKIFKWHMQYQYWQRKGLAVARLLESVVLPPTTTKPLIDDLDMFLAPEAKTFYQKHGIPYRRSYLFYGVPGTGKTSLIQALAGKLKRNICFMQPSHPEMTDDGLNDAFRSLPSASIIVLEDIDALFTKDRMNKVNGSKLTFSGLLNALDGVGSSSGQIVILTTNLRDDLDPALVRSGRVDCHVPFDYATPEQIQLLWQSYYPSSSLDQAKEFVTGVITKLEQLDVDGKANVAASELQAFFLKNRLSTADQAIKQLDLIVSERKSRTTNLEDKSDEEKEEGEGEEADTGASSGTESKGSLMKTIVVTAEPSLRVVIGGLCGFAAATIATQSGCSNKTITLSIATIFAAATAVALNQFYAPTMEKVGHSYNSIEHLGLPDESQAYSKKGGRRKGRGYDSEEEE